MSPQPDSAQSESEVTISRELAEEIQKALRQATVNAIAHYSNEPYKDDPRWSPWTRFGQRLCAQLDHARQGLREALK